MLEESKDQENNNNINLYSDYEHEAESMVRSTIKEEEKSNLSQSKVNAKSRDEKIAELKKKTEEALKLTVKNKSNTSFLKSLVSQDKNRFCFDGFDLDLTYITPRIIAMGLPSTSYEALYRNDMNDVLNFFNERHPEHYKVYNLCEEKKYAPNIFYKQGYFPFQDHEAPPLDLIRPFCEDAKQFLDEDPKNVVAIHCLAGKGRTGTLISCLLLYVGEFDTAADCLKYYGLMRVDNGKGVTVPSQIRYVFYFEQILRNNITNPINFKKLCIKKIRMVTIPAFSRITFVVENKVDGKNNVFNYTKRETIEENAPFIDYELDDEGFVVCGDVKILFFSIPMFGSKDKIFKLWFNTNFVPEDGVLETKKDLIDKACKDKNCKKFKHNFKIEVHTIDV
jgi:phosphatidylinositol-3,4,5-trisphosphate 3-phosphatase/dual-specificity protein phosphatase PTEN